MAKVTKKSSLGCLSLATLKKLGHAYEFSYVASSKKQDLIDALAEWKGVSLAGLLKDLTRDELKDICREHRLDESGRSKDELIERILGVEPQQAPKANKSDSKDSKIKKPEPTEQPQAPVISKAKQEKRSKMESKSESTNIEATLWKTADKLRSNMDAADYKHTVLGLIFLKYISDSFEEFRVSLRDQLSDENSDLYIPDASEKDIKAELEDHDNYVASNVFWVPEAARWQSLSDQAKQADIGKIIDDAMVAIEKENPKLKGILNKSYGRLDKQVRLGELIDLISSIGFTKAEHGSKDVLGQVYEYFLGQFASAEGKKGGQFYTAKCVVKLIVEMLGPYKGRVYDPAMGSGGFFVQSEKFLEAHGGKVGDLSLYGQESNPTTWRLAAMNMAIRGLDYNFGKEPADSFHNDQHPDLKADYVMANPPFNISDWGGEQITEDKRWQYGLPPAGNANFAWVQHMIHHLGPNGTAGIVLANGSMSSNTNNEGEIRKNLIEKDVVECMVALPGQLFFNTQIPVCVWFLSRNKKRKKEFLFMDCRELGTMISRVQKELTEDDLAKVTHTFQAWRAGKGYQDEAGFCTSVGLAEIQKHEHVLTPGRYVGAKAEVEDGEDFEVKMQRLTSELFEQFEESAKLEKEIRKNLKGLGYE